ncbi:hypothetical protein AC578_8880 [Pseudocercospora eumusae]|uniref:J domain-containing protein n=1 Tax=Pseudocercospora eumusae TaxID=321146 RepID=A0A139HBJ5_9PEZI|nr:hypothetical protein AC578_8880 [Pseudocercospora eumusae]
MDRTNDLEEVPLPTLYLQIQYADSPYEILGISSQPSTASALRDVYRALALRIHPDKAPSTQLRELHTSLFQKIFTAYETLLKQLDHDEDEDAHIFQPKHLPESEASLHARNIAFKEALRDARDRAIAAKHAEERAQEARREALKAKNERLAAKREEKAAKAEHDREERARAIENRRRGDIRCSRGQKLKTGPKPLGPLRNKPTAKPFPEETFSGPAATKADISHRWDKQLLSGGGAGSVSLALKKEREQSSAARLQRETLALCEESGDCHQGLHAAIAELELLNDLGKADARGEKRTVEALEV